MPLFIDADISGSYCVYGWVYVKNLQFWMGTTKNWENIQEPKSLCALIINSCKTSESFEDFVCCGFLLASQTVVVID